MSVQSGPNSRKNPSTIRLSPADEALLDKLQDKLGLGRSQIIRMSLRRFADWLDRADREHP